MLNTILGVTSLILQAMVVSYGVRLYNILRPVRFWSIGWILYTIANFLILVRRVIGFKLAYSIIIPFTPTISYEYSLQIVISILFLFFGWNLKKMYSKYFNDGLNIKSWKEEKEWVKSKLQKEK